MEFFIELYKLVVWLAVFGIILIALAGVLTMIFVWQYRKAKKYEQPLSKLGYVSGIISIGLSSLMLVYSGFDIVIISVFLISALLGMLIKIK